MIAPGCRLCGGVVQLVLELPPEPALCNALGATAGEARAAPRGPIALTVCRRCGAGNNAAFDPHLAPYDSSYENSLHVSPTFRTYAERLARDLVERHRLAGGHVVEIGAGDGEFLALLCATAGPGTTGVGFDPSAPGKRRLAGARAARARVQLIGTPFPEAAGAVDADFVCARHVLEHLVDPRALLATVRSSVRIGRTVGAYFEVPDGAHMIENGAVWDLIYEHPWYFTEPALRRVVSVVGFSVRVTRRSYGGQYLSVDARCTGGPSRSAVSVDEAIQGVEDVVRGFERFGAVVEDATRAAAASLSERRLRGERLALWGVGSKGVTFLNRVPGANELDAVVDVNPRKHGRYVPGTAQLVRSPEDLAAIGPDAVIVLNPLYRDEVAIHLACLGIDAEVVVLAGGCGSSPLAAPLVGAGEE